MQYFDSQHIMCYTNILCSTISTLCAQSTHYVHNQHIMFTIRNQHINCTYLLILINMEKPTIAKDMCSENRGDTCSYL